jgi:hypothetical protein
MSRQDEKICNLAANDLTSSTSKPSVIDIRTFHVVKSIARDIDNSWTGFD